MKKYLNERNGKLFTKLFENQGVKVNEGDYDGLPKNADGPFKPPLKTVIKKADTKPEIVQFFKWIKDQVKELTRGQASDDEIRQAFELVIRDMKKTIGKVAKDLIGLN